MSSARINEGILRVKWKLGNHAKFFDIEYSETLVDSEGYLSFTISITPKPKRMEEYEVNGSTCYLELVQDGNGPWQMIFGEDTERDITLANLYCFLYWCEATEEVA
jgi:hypothetical protein